MADESKQIIEEGTGKTNTTPPSDTKKLPFGPCIFETVTALADRDTIAEIIDLNIIDKPQKSSGKGAKANFEDIDFGLYKKNAKMIAFRIPGGRDRVYSWISVLSARYYREIGQQDSFKCVWASLTEDVSDDENSEINASNVDEIRVQVFDTSRGEDEILLFTIHVYLTTHLITVQGNHYVQWSIQEFTPLLSAVNAVTPVVTVIYNEKSTKEKMTKNSPQSAQKKTAAALTLPVEVDKEKMNEKCVVALTETESNNETITSNNENNNLSTKTDLIDSKTKKRHPSTNVTDTDSQISKDVKTILSAIRQMQDEQLSLREKLIRFESNFATKDEIAGLKNQVKLLNERNDEKQLQFVKESISKIELRQNRFEERMRTQEKRSADLTKKLSTIESSLDHVNTHRPQQYDHHKPNINHENRFQVLANMPSTNDKKEEVPPETSDSAKHIILGASNTAFMNPGQLFRNNDSVRIHCSKIKDATKNARSISKNTELVVVHIGTNDVSDNNLTAIDEYAELVDTLLEKTDPHKIVLCGIPPRYDQTTWDEATSSINRCIRDMCSQMNIRYVPSDSLRDRTFFGEDGFHYSRKGQSILCRNIISIIRPRRAPQSTHLRMTPQTPPPRRMAPQTPPPQRFNRNARNPGMPGIHPSVQGMRPSYKDRQSHPWSNNYRYDGNRNQNYMNPVNYDQRGLVQDFMQFLAMNNQ
jgi:hypothetical protein